MNQSILRVILIYVITCGIACAKAMPYVGVAAGLQFVPNYTGLMANWFAGYGFTFDCYHTYYLGAEVFADYPSAAISGEQEDRILNDVGFNLTAGVYMNPLYLLYTKLGVQYSEIKRTRSYVNGALFGIGIQGTLTPQLAFRVEDVYVGQGIFSNFLSLRSNTIRIGAIYNFTC